MIPRNQKGKENYNRKMDKRKTDTQFTEKKYK